jgi:hypothetical protein
MVPFFSRRATDGTFAPPPLSADRSPRSSASSTISIIRATPSTVQAACMSAHYAADRMQPFHATSAALASETEISFHDPARNTTIVGQHSIPSTLNCDIRTHYLRRPTTDHVFCQAQYTIFNCRRFPLAIPILRLAIAMSCLESKRRVCRHLSIGGRFRPASIDDVIARDDLPIRFDILNGGNSECT